MGSFDVKKIEKLKARKNVKRLLKALDDPDYRLSAAAAEALGEIGDPQAVWPLVAILRVTKYYEGRKVKRKAAAKALGEIGDPCAVEPLIEVLLGLDIYNIKPSVAEALMKIIGDPRAVWPLIANLDTIDRDICDIDNIKPAVAEALGKIGDPRAVWPLIANLGTKDDISEAADGALRTFRVPDVEMLIAALSVKNWDLRRGSAEVLGKIGDPRAVKPLIAALIDADSDMRQFAFYTLLEIGAPAVEPLVATLRDKNGCVRKIVARALDKLGWKPPDEEISPWFYIAINDWFKCIEIGAPAVEPLIAALKDWDRDIRKAAAKALGEIGDSRAVEPLIAALKDRDRDIRKAAAKALGEIGDSRAVEPLIAALKDRNSEAADALGKIGKPAAEPLIAVLNDENSEVRSAAAKVLGRIGDSLAVEPLIASLKDENDYVRSAAAEALGEIGDGHAVEPLIASLKDEATRIVAAEALVIIYAQVTLDGKLKQRIVAARDSIIQRIHIDQDYFCSNPPHDDYHKNLVEFPL